jgi:hypothetical protein
MQLLSGMTVLLEHRHLRTQMSSFISDWPWLKMDQVAILAF